MTVEWSTISALWGSSRYRRMGGHPFRQWSPTPAVRSATADLEAMTEVVIGHRHEIDLLAESRWVGDRGGGVLGRGAVVRFSPPRGCRRRGAVALGRSVLLSGFWPDSEKRENGPRTIEERPPMA